MVSPCKGCRFYEKSFPKCIKCCENLEEFQIKHCSTIELPSNRGDFHTYQIGFREMIRRSQAATHAAVR